MVGPFVEVRRRTIEVGRHDDLLGTREVRCVSANTQQTNTRPANRDEETLARLDHYRPLLM
jgi:hypothetical protein